MKENNVFNYFMLFVFNDLSVLNDLNDFILLNRITAHSCRDPMPAGGVPANKTNWQTAICNLCFYFKRRSVNEFHPPPLKTKTVAFYATVCQFVVFAERRGFEPLKRF